MGETEVLANYLSGMKYEDLPADVITRVKELIADTIACGLGGRKTLEGDVLIDIAKEIGGKPEATIIGDKTKVSCMQAAQINRVLTNMLDYDDVLVRTMQVGHTTTVLLPVALAIGEHVNASGKDIISALVPGYEGYIRIREAINPSEQGNSNFQRPDTGIAFGAVTVAGKLLGLNGGQMADAFGLTGRVRTWRLTHRDPGQVGMVRWQKITGGDVTFPAINAAFLAKRGFPGERMILDSGRGYAGYELSVGSDRYDATKLTADLGKEYRLMQIGFKAYPQCAYTHPTLAAVSAIVSENGIKAEDVELVIAKVPKEMVELLGRYEPDHILRAEFNIPHGITMVLMGKTPGPSWYTEDILNDPKVREFQHKVRLEEDPEALSEYPAIKPVGAVEITTKDGKRFSKHVNSRKGDPDNPLTRQEHVAKMTHLASWAGMKQSQIDKLIRTLDSLEELGNIKELTRLLVP